LTLSGSNAQVTLPTDTKKFTLRATDYEDENHFAAGHRKVAKGDLVVFEEFTIAQRVA